MKAKDGVPEQGDEFLVVHTSIQSAIRDLEPVNIQDGKYGTGFSWINKLVTMPCCRRWACFRFTVANDTGDNEMWIVHHSTKCNGQGITELAAFVDTPRGLRVDMTVIHE